MNNYSTKKGACTLTTDQQPHDLKAVNDSMNHEAGEFQLILSYKDGIAYASDGYDTTELLPGTFQMIVDAVAVAGKLKQEGNFNSIEEYLTAKRKRREKAQRLNRAAKLQGLKGAYTYGKIKFFCPPGDAVFIATADHRMFGIRKGDYIYICLTKRLLNGDWGLFRTAEKNVLGVYSDAGIGRAVVLGECELYEDFEIIGRAVGFYRGFSRASRKGWEPDKTRQNRMRNA